MRKTLALEQREEALTVSHELKVLAEMASLPTEVRPRLTTPNPNPNPNANPNPNPQAGPGPGPQPQPEPTQAERRTLSRGRGAGTRRGTRRAKKAR